MRSMRWATTAVGSVACALTLGLAMAGCAANTATVGAPDPGLRGQLVLTSGDVTVFRRSTL